MDSGDLVGRGKSLGPGGPAARTFVRASVASAATRRVCRRKQKDRVIHSVDPRPRDLVCGPAALLWSGCARPQTPSSARRGRQRIHISQETQVWFTVRAWCPTGPPFVKRLDSPDQRHSSGWRRRRVLGGRPASWVVGAVRSRADVTHVDRSGVHRAWIGARTAVWALGQARWIEDRVVLLTSAPRRESPAGKRMRGGAFRHTPPGRR
jgi:hypothetical protein